MSGITWERRLDNEKLCPPEEPETPAMDACYEISYGILSTEPGDELEARERLDDVYRLSRSVLREAGCIR